MSSTTVVSSCLPLGPFVRWNGPRVRHEAAGVAPQEVGSVLFEASCGFAYFLKLSRLRRSALPPCWRSFFGRNEVDLTQFETVLVFQHDAGHPAVPFTFDDDEALIRPEPHLETFLTPMRRRTDFAETELLQKCKRVPHGLDKLLQRWRLDLVCHHNSPKRGVGAGAANV